MATIFGTSKNDVLWDEGNLADVITGGKGNDILLGLGGDDILDGGSGKDRLDGGSGDDQLSAGSGNDRLDGGLGDDLLIGGNGHDRMSGGDGMDTFVFQGKSGKDTITDFDLTHDVLQIAKSKTIKTVDDVIKHSTQLKNGDLVIDLGKGNKITLKDVSKADFKQNPDDHITIV
jgi:Ca2+-binding RTX toxin-like protein